MLIVDDNPVNIDILTGYLNHFGCRPNSAISGKAALDALRQGIAENAPYELCIVDYLMPEMDGFEATRIIRDPASRVKNHQIPVIAMTARAMKGDKERCLEVGMDNYLPKPINRDNLFQMLQRYLKS